MEVRTSKCHSILNGTSLKSTRSIYEIDSNALLYYLPFPPVRSLARSGLISTAGDI